MCSAVDERPSLVLMALAAVDGSEWLAPGIECLLRHALRPCACSCRTLSFMRSGAAQVRVGCGHGWSMWLGFGVGGGGAASE
jgi:hypothetical protein